MNQLHTANTITDSITPCLDSFHLNPAGFIALLLLILENYFLNIIGQFIYKILVLLWDVFVVPVWLIYNYIF